MALLTSTARVEQMATACNANPSNHQEKKLKSTLGNEATIQATNDSSIGSKYSMASIGYFQDKFLQYFVKKTRRAPLINRGYCVRAKTIEFAVKSFILEYCGKNEDSQVISLGAGFDTTFFRLQEQGMLSNTRFLEIDFPDVVKRKISAIERNKELLQCVGPFTKHDNGIIANSYALVACDITDIKKLNVIMESTSFMKNIPSLFISEVVLTYIDKESCSRLIQWANNHFENSMFLMYEQIHPSDAFGLLMKNHFERLQSPLLCIEAYPDIESQRERFISMGWTTVNVINMNEFYYDVVSNEERDRIDKLEPFDEFEEWHQKCYHYSVVAAFSGSCSTLNSKLFTGRRRDNFNKTCNPEFCRLKVQNEDSLEFERYGHCLLELRKGLILVSGGFGRIGLKHQRLSDSFIIQLGNENRVNIAKTSILKDPRMHHSLSLLDDNLIFLFGGRSSPSKPCKDYSIMRFKDEIDTELSDEKCIEHFETVWSGELSTIDSENCEKQPDFRWRHTATQIHFQEGGEHVLVFGGRNNKSFVLSDLWTFDLKSCSWKEETVNAISIKARHSHAASKWKDSIIFSGGIDQESRPLNLIEILDYQTKPMRLDTIIFSNPFQARYSHSSFVLNDNIWMVGGIGLEAFPPLLRIDLNTKSWCAFDISSTRPIMLCNHTSNVINDDQIVIVGGGGNCFSFGTHFNKAGRNFVIGNAQVDGCPIIYCNRSICELTGYERSELVQKPCSCDFLYGPETDPNSVSQIRRALQGYEETRISSVIYYKKNGNTFTCSVVVSPIKNEAGVVLMYVVSHEDLGSEVSYQVGKSRKSRNDKKRSRRSRSRMKEEEYEEIALLQKTIEQELKPINGRFNKFDDKSSLKFNGERCDGVEEHGFNKSSEMCCAPNHARLAKKLSRSASDLQSPVSDMLNEHFFDSHAAFELNKNLGANKRIRKVSSSLGDLSKELRRHNDDMKSNKAIFQSITSYKKSDNIYDIAYPAVPPSRQTSINPGQKVAQVMSLGTDILPEYKVESPKIHPWTVLHYSPFKAIWDWVVLFLVMYTAILTPYMAAFELTSKSKSYIKDGSKSYTTEMIYDDPLVIVDYIVDVMFIIDIFINFRTTFVDRNDEVVSDPCRIALYYVKGWFVIDLLAAIPFELLIMIGNTERTTTLIGLLKTARLLRLVRVARKVDRYSEYGMALLLLLMFGFALIAHWLACIWYALGNFEKPSLNMDGWLAILARDTRMPYNASDSASGPDLKTKYITALYFTLSSLTSVGFGNISPNTNGEKIFTIVIMFVGALMYAVIFGNVTAIIQGLYSGMAHYHATMRRVREFIRFYQIPSQLRQRLEDYAQYDYSYTNGIDMNEVLKKFPEGLRADICLHLNRHLLSNNPVFRSATPGCLRTLSLKLKTSHCPPGDYIIHYGDEIKNLYWIGRGTVEVIENDTITAILGKGDVFGENFSSVSDRPIGKSKASVRALTYCDLHAIERDDAFYIIGAYPDFKDNLIKDLQITFDLRDLERETIDRQSTLLVNTSKSHEPNGILKSPEKLKAGRTYHTVNVQMENSEEMLNEDKYIPPSERVNDRANIDCRENRLDDIYEDKSSDCCNCNVELRRDINRLKLQLNHLEKTLNSSMKKILSHLGESDSKLKPSSGNTISNSIV
eukprot:gene3810-4338_t